MNNKFKPTESELEILQILWEHEPCTVRYINDELNKERKVGYTTTLKIMQLMLEKGLLSRTEKGRKHLYSTVYKENEAQEVLLDKFLKTTFKGSAMKLVMQALGNHKTSKDELAQIKELINKMEKKD